MTENETSNIQPADARSPEALTALREQVSGLNLGTLAKETPPNPDRDYARNEAGAGSVEEAARAFLNDAPAAGGITYDAKPAFALVVDNDAPATPEENDELERKRAEAIKDIMLMIDQALGDSELSGALRKLLNDVLGAKSIRELEKAHKGAETAMAQSGGGETEREQEEKTERMMQEVQKASDELKEDSHKLDQWKSEEQKKRETKAEEEERLARENLRRLQEEGASPKEIYEARKALLEANKRVAETTKEGAQEVKANPVAPEEVKREADHVIEKSAEVNRKIERADNQIEAATKTEKKTVTSLNKNTNLPIQDILAQLNDSTTTIFDLQNTTAEELGGLEVGVTQAASKPVQPIERG